MRTAHKLGSEIVRHGGIVLSGLTAGIDRSAAEGALDAGGVCVGVSGTAINLDFAGACTQSVARFGAVVSEFAPNMSVPRFGFRLRNRITSGLAVATVVVEAPEKKRRAALRRRCDHTGQGGLCRARKRRFPRLRRQQRAAQGRSASGDVCMGCAERFSPYVSRHAARAYRARTRTRRAAGPA